MAHLIDLRQKKKTALKKTVKETDRVQNQNFLISWHSLSHYHQPKKTYLVTLVILLALIGLTLIYLKKDILLIILSFLAPIVLILQVTKKPDLLNVSVDKTGVTVDDRKYNYRELKSFWIHYDIGGIKELSLEMKKWYRPYVRILLEDRDPSKVRSLLVKFIPEKEQESSIIEDISRNLGL